MQDVVRLGTFARDDAFALFERVESSLWDGSRAQWRGRTGSTVRAPYGTQIIRNDVVARLVWDSVVALFDTEVVLTDHFTPTDTITLAKNGRAIERHRDNVAYAGDWKLLVYCNHSDDGDVAGTRFFTRDGGSVDMAYAPGAVVLFNLALEHEGLPVPQSKLKRTLGLRLQAR